MDAVLESLIPLADLDDRKRGLQERVRSSDRKLANGAKKRDEAIALRESIDARMKERRAVTAKQETELRRFEQQRDRANRALESGMGSADAAQRQIDTCSERIDELETEILEAMEVREEDEEALAAAITAVDTAIQTLVDIEAEHRPILAELHSELADVDTRRATYISALPSYEQRTYQELTKRKGYALSAIVDRTCSACQNTIPYAMQNDLRQGRLINCETCHRWLFFRE